MMVQLMVENGKVNKNAHVALKTPKHWFRGNYEDIAKIAQIYTATKFNGQSSESMTIAQ